MTKKEKGAFSIDAVIGILVFMLTILAIIFLALVIRVQANMQYAIGQTAKEISGYYYLLDKIGLTSITSGALTSGSDQAVADLNQNIAVVLDFGSAASDTASALYDDVEGAITASEWEDFTNNLNNAYTDVTSLDTSQIKDLLDNFSKDDAIGQIKAVLQIFGKSMINKSFSYFVAPFVCNALTPKYLTSGDIDDYYKTVGIDPETVDYTQSQLLMDGRSVKIVVMYDLDISKLTFGMVNLTKPIKIKQVAATAAWVRPNETGSVKKVSQSNGIEPSSAEGGEGGEGGE